MTNFYSMQFLIFLSIALVCYYTILKNRQWICLLMVSAVFYAWTGVHNFVFLLLVGTTTWAGAMLIERNSARLKAVRKDNSLDKAHKDSLKAKMNRERRTVMWGVVLVNFVVLAFLKYIPNGNTALRVVLPLGISFYMFQSIGYLLDVYNEKYEPEKNFARYMLFVSYFPQMIQGPINRFDMMREQMRKSHQWNGENAQKALYKIGYGLLKKYAIANILSGPIANIFDNPVRDYAGATVLMGILLYSAQQYADFSGGIDMVLGVSELFGIRMTENFRQPYFSISLADFWRRWHISLGKWMRDYVFYPFALTKPMKKFGKWSNQKLGKHIGRVLPAAIGNILVFLVVGIWHGAELHYIIWGFYNGFIIAISDILKPVYDKITEMFKMNKESVGYCVFQILRTFVIVNIGWYFDRISSVRVALYSLKKTVLDFNIELFEAEQRIVFEHYPKHALWVVAIACIFVFIVSIMKERKIEVRNVLYTKPALVRWGIYLFVIGMILVSNTCVNETGGFMYANF